MPAPPAVSGAIAVLLVDDHPVVREGMAGLLGAQPDLRVVAEGGNGEEALALFQQHRPAVTVMDLRMPVMDGLQALQAIRREDAQARVVILTTFSGDVQALRAIKLGAAGYLLKSTLRHDLVETVRAVHAGRRCIPPEVAAALAQHAADDGLSEREAGVLRLVADGNSNRRVGELLGLSEETVKAHLRSIMSKLGANDRTHAVTIALTRGFIHM